MMTMASNILEDSFKNYDKSLLASDLPRAICLETQRTPGAVADPVPSGNPWPSHAATWILHVRCDMELAAELEKSHRGAKDMHPLSVEHMARNGPGRFIHDFSAILMEEHFMSCQ